MNGERPTDQATPPSAPAKRSLYDVVLKDRDGEIPTFTDDTGEHWQAQGEAQKLLVGPQHHDSYNGHVKLPTGPTVFFTARLNEHRIKDDQPDFNLFVTDERFNVYKIGRTWHSFDGLTFCAPTGLWKRITKDSKRHYLSGYFDYLGERWYIQLWYNFRAKEQARAEARATSDPQSQPLSPAPFHPDA